MKVAGISAVTAVVGQLGDLAESVLKRSVGVKDSSSILPGHGGILDRLDSLFFASPVFYWLFNL
jgi:phosphatidate cytidylyltransferase